MSARSFSLLHVTASDEVIQHFAKELVAIFLRISLLRVSQFCGFDFGNPRCVQAILGLAGLACWTALVLLAKDRLLDDAYTSPISGLLSDELLPVAHTVLKSIFVGGACVWSALAVPAIVNAVIGDGGVAER
eukprot:6176535-Pleurochrysis_carterae.AAC.4